VGSRAKRASVPDVAADVARIVSADMHPRETREHVRTRRATAQEAKLAAEYERLRALETYARKMKQEVGAALCSRARDYGRLTLEGAAYVTIVHHPGSPTYDVKALLTDHPELASVLDQYRRPGKPYSYPSVQGLEPAPSDG